MITWQRCNIKNLRKKNSGPFHFNWDLKLHHQDFQKTIFPNRALPHSKEEVALKSATHLLIRWVTLTAVELGVAGKRKKHSHNESARGKILQGCNSSFSHVVVSNESANMIILWPAVPLLIPLIRGTLIGFKL
jgi:hypothetical protein